MNKLRVIDLLNKIANDEGVPIKLLAFGKHYEWKQPVKDYMNEDGDYLIEELLSADLNSLCEEIPLIEEDKKIEKLVFNKDQDGDILVNGVSLIDKVNEIIDKLDKEE